MKVLSYYMSLLVFFKVGKKSRTALDLNDCWYATNFVLFGSQCFTFEEYGSSLYFKYNFAIFFLLRLYLSYFTESEL